MSILFTAFRWKFIKCECLFSHQMFKMFTLVFKKFQKSQGKFHGLINCIRSLSTGSGLDQLISGASWSWQTINQPEKMQTSKRRVRYLCGSTYPVFRYLPILSVFFHCLWRCWSSSHFGVGVVVLPPIGRRLHYKLFFQTRQFFGRPEITLCTTHPSDSCNKCLFVSFKKQYIDIEV